MIDCYINKKIKKQKWKKELNQYIFGMTYGFGMVLIFIFRLLYKNLGLLSIIDLIFIIYGLFCIALATINPNFKILEKIRNITVWIFNFIGNLLLKGTLVIVYFIFVVPVGIWMKKQKENKTTNFVDYKASHQMKLGKYKFLKIFRLFSSEYFYMLPLIIILLIISIFVILITSSVFTPLIYTLF